VPELPEFSGRDRVADVLADVGYVVGDYVRPPGVAEAYETVRRRRRNRLVAAGVLGAALVLGPAAGLALANGPDARTPTADHPTPPPTTPTPSPTPTAPASPSAGPTGAPPDGRISLAQLTAAPLEIPPWPKGYNCATGQIRLKAPPGRQGERLREKVVGAPLHVDVDGDGGVETALLLQCDWDGVHRRVVVLDRDAGGRIVLLGEVLRTDPSDDGRGIATVWSVAATAEGRIRVDVGDYPTCCALPPDLAQHQWRTYGWDGQRFTHTGGPTGFDPNPAVSDLSVTADGVVLRPVNGGSYTSRPTVTIRNDGPSRADLELEVTKDDKVLSVGVIRRGDCGVIPDDHWFECRLGWLGKGSTLTVTLDVRAQRPVVGSLHIHVRAVDRDSGALYPEADLADNEAHPRVETRS
jgi:hypothetical protein